MAAGAQLSHKPFIQHIEREAAAATTVTAATAAVAACVLQELCHALLAEHYFALLAAPCCAKDSRTDGRNIGTMECMSLDTKQK